MASDEVSFDPAGAATESECIRSLLRAFVDNLVYRSAKVEELTVADDFTRRPLRPEDLSLIDFSQPLSGRRVTDLCALATNRMLLCIHEAAWPRLPARDDDSSWIAFDAYFGSANRVLGAQIRPFLEDFVFCHLQTPARRTLEDRRSPEARVVEAAAERRSAEDALAAAAAAADVAVKRMIWLQFAGPISGKRTAIAVARAAGALDAAGGDAVPDLPGGAAADAIEEVCRELALNTAAHAHWQFYLPTTLASANLMHRNASDPRCACRLAGALVFARLQHESFLQAHAANSRCLRSNAVGRGTGLSWDDAVAALSTALRQVTDRLARHSQRAAREALLGFEEARLQQRIADADLRAQVDWLCNLSRAGEAAHALDRKIRDEAIEIDRDTFVEPRDMCSTTHVHDDHRLVVIETGRMLFWGAPGMRLQLDPGEMTLVPRGRLHGSSVESDECVYHQPIIPEAWLARLWPVLADVAASVHESGAMPPVAEAAALAASQRPD